MAFFSDKFKNCLNSVVIECDKCSSILDDIINFFSSLFMSKKKKNELNNEVIYFINELNSTYVLPIQEISDFYNQVSNKNINHS